jgi:hypothetical protein
LVPEFRNLAILEGQGVRAVQVIHFQERAEYSALQIIQLKGAKDPIPIFDVKAALSVHDQSQITFGGNAGTATDESERDFFLSGFEDAVESSQNFSSVIAFQENLIHIGRERIVGDSIANACQSIGLNTGHDSLLLSKKSNSKGRTARGLKYCRSKKRQEFQGGAKHPPPGDLS